MFRLFHLALITAVIVLGSIGISRLSYNVEILDLLPRGMAGVEGTKWFQKVYDRPDQLIVTITAKTDADADEAVTAFADALKKKPELARKVSFLPSWEAHPQDMLDMVALAWLNAPPEQLSALESSLAPLTINKTIKDRVARLGSSLDPMTVAIESSA